MPFRSSTPLDFMSYESIFRVSLQVGKFMCLSPNFASIIILLIMLFGKDLDVVEYCRILNGFNVRNISFQKKSISF